MKTKEENKMLRELLYFLTHDANRVSVKYGHDDDGTPSDWTEWRNVRNSLQQVKYFEKKYGKLID